MKKLVFLFLCLITFGAVRAQDVIVKKDGGTILAKVVRVTTDVVKYKDFSDQSGSLKSINVSELLVINYEDGERETFSNLEEAEVKKVKEQEVIESPKQQTSDEDLLRIYNSMNKNTGNVGNGHQKPIKQSVGASDNDDKVIQNKGTEIPLQVNGKYKLSQQNNGKSVDFYVAEDVVVGETIIPAGSRAIGKVFRKNNLLKPNASFFRILISNIILPNGKNLQISDYEVVAYKDGDVIPSINIILNYSRKKPKFTFQIYAVSTND